MRAHGRRTLSERAKSIAILLYRQAALGGLSKGRDRRRWGQDEILAAMQQFEAQSGRWPSLGDLRAANGLPS